MTLFGGPTINDKADNQILMQHSDVHCILYYVWPVLILPTKLQMKLFKVIDLIINDSSMYTFHSFIHFLTLKSSIKISLIDLLVKHQTCLY